MYPRIVEFGTIDLLGQSVPLIIYSYVVMIVLGFLSVWYGLKRELLRKGHSSKLAGRTTFWAFVAGFFGANVYYLIEFGGADSAKGPVFYVGLIGGVSVSVLVTLIKAKSNSRIRGKLDLFTKLVFWAGWISSLVSFSIITSDSKLTGGFVFYGGLIGGIVAVLVIIVRAKEPVWSIIDSIGPLLLLGYGIGRIGCFLAGDGCYGRPGDAPWCVTFPEAIAPIFHYQDQLYCVTTEVPNGTPDGAILTTVHPTPIYETILSFLSFGLLWRVRLQLEQRIGVLFGLALLSMGVARFIIEFWRINIKYLWDLLSGAQLISLALIAFGLLIVGYRWSKTPSS